MKTLVIVILAVGAIFLIFRLQERRLEIVNLPLKIEVADTNEERVRGLSGRESLRADAGLLFVFDSSGQYGIWMKDMNFPIDIAWIDEGGKVVHLEHDVSPDTYPQVFIPPIDALFVLETNSGFFAKNKIEIGQTLEIKGL